MCISTRLTFASQLLEGAPAERSTHLHHKLVPDVSRLPAQTWRVDKLSGLASHTVGATGQGDGRWTPRETSQKKKKSSIGASLCQRAFGSRCEKNVFPPRQLFPRDMPVGSCNRQIQLTREKKIIREKNFFLEASEWAASAPKRRCPGHCHFFGAMKSFICLPKIKFETRP